MTLGTENTPLRIAIIGSGPSGFYAADFLSKSELNITIDAFDKLPTPYGLLRGGVAPDHQKMKSIGNFYERIATKNPNFSFWGNVTVGKDISITELKEHYDAIIITSGAETDKKLGIPGESLNGSYTATEFVAWYNGHPHFQENKFDLNKEKIAIIGQGNVAIDVTRILAKTEEELSTSDITENALSQLKNSAIKEIHLIGRRGPAQAAFTELEIKELGELEDCDVIVNPKDLDLNEASQKEVEENNKAKKNYPILQALSKKESGSKSKKIILHFLKSPLEIIGDDHVTGLKLETNKLSGEAGSQKARGTGEIEELDCDLVFRSIGYKGVPINEVPFDEKKGIIPNNKGRVENGSSELTHLYVSGWIKRGATGVLGTNKPDSRETIETLLEDLPKLKECPNRSSESLKTLLSERNIRVITFDDWKKIDAEEIKRGQDKNKPREKFTSTQSILEFLDN